ncbi:MAG: hypothetical protein ACT6FD_02285 [Methanosarcinaceae archaeon]
MTLTIFFLKSMDLDFIWTNRPTASHIAQYTRPSCSDVLNPETHTFPSTANPTTLSGLSHTRPACYGNPYHPNPG